MATSLPPQSPDAQQHPANVYAERMARVDGCPQACGNSETPMAVESTPDGFVAFYSCADCPTFWSTSWSER